MGAQCAWRGRKIRRPSDGYLATPNGSPPTRESKKANPQADLFIVRRSLHAGSRRVISVSEAPRNTDSQSVIGFLHRCGSLFGQAVIRRLYREAAAFRQHGLVYAAIARQYAYDGQAFKIERTDPANVRKFGIQRGDLLREFATMLA
jgi:hypothetical protein